MKIKTYFAIFFGLLILVFALQNSEMTEVSFLIWELKLSRIFIILGSFGIGILIGLLFAVKKHINY